MGIGFGKSHSRGRKGRVHCGLSCERGAWAMSSELLGSTSSGEEAQSMSFPARAWSYRGRAGKWWGQRRNMYAT